jgi:hypothetical protein
VRFDIGYKVNKQFNRHKGGVGMLSNLEPSLNTSFSMADMFYVSVLFDERAEIMPIEVDFEEVFYDLIEIKTEIPLNRYQELIVNMYNDDVMYNISGKVLRCIPDNGLFLSTIRIEDLPTKLFNELMGLVKDMVGEVNEK